MAEFVCFQIELSKSYGASEWREDIKGLMLKAGLYNTETVFLFSDTQVKDCCCCSKRKYVQNMFLVCLHIFSYNWTNTPVSTDKIRIISGRLEQYSELWGRPEYIPARWTG